MAGVNIKFIQFAEKCLDVVLAREKLCYQAKRNKNGAYTLDREIKKEICNRYTKGESLHCIAKEISTTRWIIRSVLKENGVYVKEK